MITAVLDVNVLIAAVLAPRGTTRQVLVAWEAQRFQVVASEGIIAEVGHKLRDRAIGGRYRVSDQDIVSVRNLLWSQATIVSVQPQDVWPVTGDSEDDYILATARLGRADYLVTGDHGLQALQTHAGCAIVSPRAFLTILEGS